MWLDKTGGYPVSKHRGENSTLAIQKMMEVDHLANSLLLAQKGHLCISLDGHMQSPKSNKRASFASFLIKVRNQHIFSTRPYSTLPLSHAPASKSKTGNTTSQRHPQAARPYASERSTCSPKDAATSPQR